jgi:SRSO17 transposase
MTMVEYAHRRHWVERFHEEAQGLLGWDQYQGRLWTGYHRHAVTVMLADSYLMWREWRKRQDRRRVPLPEVRRQVVDWLRDEARREFEPRGLIARFRLMLN